ncbi:type I-G CRISPR-associated protein, Cas3-extension family [Methylomicrobium sp. RS1]|uniref:type I-G CRISPR-associated protein, Cas3-extension family n=1 Tax=Candidatus Methylomicrobium oryzae TaxID=2802053 RepID=UPI001922A454|nr:hypothetical protein [Methylomicrobium sp. RS1]MBL1263957.1 hypothetical protein [Methylomicrobium sp. RS1]
MNDFLKLKGLDGSNPLGFLAALGTLVVSARLFSNVRLSWMPISGALRPALWNCGNDKYVFVESLNQELANMPMTVFEIDKKLPFAIGSFTGALRDTQNFCSQKDRRTADLLTAFGSEVIKDKEVFESTDFRMVRSGDAAGQGLTAYAIAIRQATDFDVLQRALFEIWDYRDEGFSLRWDPLEDQRYALRWHDPSSQTNKKYGPQTIRGANALAIEAMALFPAMPCKNKLMTTGFYENGRRSFFTWPIWDSPLGIDSIRSLISLPELHCPIPSRAELNQRGVIQIYRCGRIAPNQYYKNFTPSFPA